MARLFGGVERRTNPYENPSIPLTDAGLLDFFGGSPTDAGVSINEQTALKFSAVWRAVSLLSGLVAGLPLKTYRYSDKSEVLLRPLYRPSAVATPFELWEQVMVHLLLWGNAYVHKVRNSYGSIVELRPIHPSRVKPDLILPDTDSDPNAGKIFVVTDKSGQAHPYTTYEIMHIPGMGYDGIQGISPIAMARQSIAIGQAADTLAAKFYGNGTLLSGILTTDRVLQPEQADALKVRWREKMSGLRHGHDVAVMDAGTKFQPIQIPPEDAQFLQTRRWQVIDVARWYGLPPHLLSDVEKSTSWGSGIEQQNMGLVTFTLKAWLTRIEQRVTWEVVEPTTQYAEFLVENLLRGDAVARATFYGLAIQWGWMTRNEARRKENLEPIDGLDEPLTPLNMGIGIAEETPILGAGKPALGDGSGSADDDDPDDDDDTDPNSPTAGKQSKAK
jgi:HK97 family phage portal protein